MCSAGLACTEMTDLGQLVSADGGEVATLLEGECLGVATHRSREFLELVECRVDAHQRELLLDDLEVKLPDVFEDSAVPTSRVVPTFTWRARTVGATANGDEDGGSTGERRAVGCGQALVGQAPRQPTP